MTGGDPSYTDLSQTFSTQREPGRGAVLRPPKPQIAPSAKVLQLTTQYNAEPEAAD